MSTVIEETSTVQVIRELLELGNTWRMFLTNCVVRAYYDALEDAIVLEQIYVPAKHRRNGYGDAIMDELTTIADGVGKRVILTPDDCFGTPIKVLSDFYSRHGFSWVFGPNRIMVRHPQ